MQIAHAEKIPWGPVSGHRGNGIEFKRLLNGSVGTADNFEFSLVRTASDYFTPRHRHNFDQVRFAIEGTFNYSPGRDLPAGTVGYFPEGTFYGPQAETAGCVVLVLQMGGASGAGFMSYDQLHAGYEQLCDLGGFDRGVFSRKSADGRANRKDGYEAVWEHVNRRTLEYPGARYEEPVVMHPAGFSWIEAGDGFEIKRLGAFGERGLEISCIRGRAGARHRADKHASPELLFVTCGELRAKDSGKTIGASSAFRIDPSDEGAEFEVVTNFEMIAIQLPRFDRAARAAS
jgi:hypothetical protein